MSSLTWLDFSDAERKRALQVVDLLARQEARDELGIGAIRDAFSNALFPGMSTVQRRARYFLFVPWIFRDVERRRAGRTDALTYTDSEELKLVETLLAAHETDGVIGARARSSLRQLPSMIYWQGLERWGIRRVAGTREQWARAVARSRGTAPDDDGQLVDRDGSWWHVNLPDPPNDWPEEATLRLRATEAEYLRERVRERCGDTLLATLVERRQVWQPVAFVWQLDIPELSATQRRTLTYARRFSEVMHGAALLYNHALAVASEDEEREAHYRERLAAWVQDEELADRGSAPLDDFWSLVADLGSRHTARTKMFVDAWVRLTADPTRVLEDPTLVERVREREREIKGTKARLSFDAARETWSGAAGALQLDYRWWSAQRQLLDIIEAGDD